MTEQGSGVGGPAEYDVAHIDIDQYRQLRALVLEGRAKARIIVERLDRASMIWQFTGLLPGRKKA